MQERERGREKKTGENLDLPEVRVFLKGRLLSDVTLLLSADSATEGSGVGVSEWERSCIARPPELLELCEP